MFLEQPLITFLKIIRSKGSFIIYEVGGGIYTKVVANVANHLDKTYVMVNDDECEGQNWKKMNLKKLFAP